MRLGRLPHDPSRYAVARRYAVAAPTAIPARLDRSGLPYVPGLYRNDNLGDCGAVGLANSLAAATAVWGNFRPNVSEARVVELFARLAGIPWPASDAALEGSQGLILQDALATVLTTGAQLDDQAPYVIAPPTAVPHDRYSLARTVMARGSAYLGVTLTEADMAAFQAGAPWDIDVARTVSPPVGGHCLLWWDWLGLGDGDVIRLSTWGVNQVACPAWVEARAEEAWDVDWRLALAS